MTRKEAAEFLEKWIRDHARGPADADAAPALLFLRVLERSAHGIHVDHQKRHLELHRALDELVTDWITHAHPLPCPSKVPVLRLMEWSKLQAAGPDHGMELAP